MSAPTQSRLLLLAAPLVALAAAVASWWPTEEQPPPPPPPAPVVDPREHGVDVDAGVVAPEERFATALTGHRGHVAFGDVDAIQRRGVLRVLTRNNASSYFLYRGVERGFDFEIGTRLAALLAVRLEMIVAPTGRDLVPWLLDGRGDVVLAGLSTDATRVDRVTLSRPYMETRWVVVVPKRRGARPLRDIDGLSDWSLLVKPSSSALSMLRQRAHTVPRGLTIVAARETFESEDLLDEVKLRPRSAAVVEERVARLELMHRSDLLVAFTFDDPVHAAIATRKEDTKLAAVIDAFLAEHLNSTEWRELYRRYHESPRHTAVAVDDRRRADKDGRLTPWDELFRAHAARVRVDVSDGNDDEDDSVTVDWRLLAAIAVQESGLDEDAESAFGAVGLMQLLPSTAQENGCDDPRDPPCAIRASSRYLGRLIRRFSTPFQPPPRFDDAGVGIDDGIDPHRTVALKDRVRFALAAYNAGAGHVDDARALAFAYGLDPDRWFGHVEQAMLLLEKPLTYRDTAHGFCRASETVAYVSAIQSRFDAYVALTSR